MIPGPPRAGHPSPSSAASARHAPPDHPPAYAGRYHRLEDAPPVSTRPAARWTAIRGTASWWACKTRSTRSPPGVGSWENALHHITDDVAQLHHIGHRTDSASCDSRLSTLLRLGSSILDALRAGRAPAATHTGGADEPRSRLARDSRRADALVARLEQQPRGRQRRWPPAGPGLPDRQSGSGSPTGLAVAKAVNEFDAADQARSNTSRRPTQDTTRRPAVGGRHAAGVTAMEMIDKAGAGRSSVRIHADLVRAPTSGSLPAAACSPRAR